MKRFFSISTLLTISLVLFIANPLFSNQPKDENVEVWQINFGLESQVFIENNGQFDKLAGEGNSSIFFGVDQGAMKVFFTKDGLIYRFTKKYKHPYRRKGDTTKPKLLTETQFIFQKWEGANPDAELIAEAVQPHTYTYSLLSEDRSSVSALEKIPAYKKLTYKNLYPGIDAEYIFHPEGGLKYALIVHPGADPSKIHFTYRSPNAFCIDKDGLIRLETFYGEMIEHRPLTFYQDNTESIVASRFEQKGNQIAFGLEKYDQSRTLVIDPWVQSPSLPNSNAIWEVETDAAGNVYVIGGDMPMRLLKYNPLGALQWSYVTPWDTANNWLGTIATDNAGNSYITSGSVAAIQRINTNGGLVWNNGGSAFNNDEYWTIAFNCDQTKLVIGGTRLGFFPPSTSNGVIFDISTTNGNILSFQFVSSTRPSFLIDDINEVRSITSSRNGRYYFLTLEDVGAINQSLGFCSNEPVFYRSSGYSFAYKSEFYRPSTGNAGICAIAANDQYVYTRSGTTVHRRDLNTGAIINSAAIPGGINTTSLGFNQPGNNGIALDDCGSVYIGSSDRLLKFDAALNLISQVTTPFRIFDVAIGANGEVIVCGATGNSNSAPRTGYVQAFQMSACNPFPLICCDATICPADTLCSTDAAINLTASSPGGTWSGTGIVNASNGTFDPTVAGPGLHPVTYSLACGTHTVMITVVTCATLTVCVEQNGSITVTGGSGPYTWQREQLDCSGCPFGNCVPLFCPGVMAWTTFATGQTIPAQTAFPIRVTDAGNNQLLIPNAAALDSCGGCGSMSLATVQVAHISCFGANDGGIALNCIGGTPPYSYIWQPGNLTGSVHINLAPGVYNITATDADLCTATLQVTLNQPTVLQVALTATAEDCGQANGTATANITGGTVPYQIQWNSTPPQFSNPATGLSAGSYMANITDNNGCQTSGTVNVPSNNTPGGTPGLWTWLGALDSNWFQPCNWDKFSIPDSLSDVYVPGGTPFNPRITGDTAWCKTITIHATAGGFVDNIVSQGGFLMKKP